MADVVQFRPSESHARVRFVITKTSVATITLDIKPPIPIPKLHHAILPPSSIGLTGPEWTSMLHRFICVVVCPITLLLDIGEGKEKVFVNLNPFIPNVSFEEALKIYPLNKTCYGRHSAVQFITVHCSGVHIPWFQKTSFETSRYYFLLCIRYILSALDQAFQLPEKHCFWIFQMFCFSYVKAHLVCSQSHIS